MAVIRFLALALVAAGIAALRWRQKQGQTSTGGSSKMLSEGKAVLAESASDLKAAAGEAAQVLTKVVRNTKESSVEKASRLRTAQSSGGAASSTTPAVSVSGASSGLAGAGMSTSGERITDADSEASPDYVFTSSNSGADTSIQTPSAGSEGGEMVNEELTTHPSGNTPTDVSGVGVSDQDAASDITGSIEGLLEDPSGPSRNDSDAYSNQAVPMTGQLDIRDEGDSDLGGSVGAAPAESRREGDFLNGEEIVIRPADDGDRVTVQEATPATSSADVTFTTRTTERDVDTAFSGTASAQDIDTRSASGAQDDPIAMNIVPEGGITTEDYQNVEVSLPPETHAAIQEMEQGTATGQYDFPIQEGYSVEAIDGGVGTVCDVVHTEGSEPYMVVKKGMLFKSDVNVPFSAVDRVEGDTVFLNMEKEYIRLMEDKSGPLQTGDSITRVDVQ